MDVIKLSDYQPTNNIVALPTIGDINLEIFLMMEN